MQVPAALKVGGSFLGSNNLASGQHLPFLILSVPLPILMPYIQQHTQQQHCSSVANLVAKADG
jgi:hypothetical protein